MMKTIELPRSNQRGRASAARVGVVPAGTGVAAAATLLLMGWVALAGGSAVAAPAFTPATSLPACLDRQVPGFGFVQIRRLVARAGRLSWRRPPSGGGRLAAAGWLPEIVLPPPVEPGRGPVSSTATGPKDPVILPAGVAAAVPAAPSGTTGLTAMAEDTVHVRTEDPARTAGKRGSARRLQLSPYPASTTLAATAPAEEGDDAAPAAVTSVAASGAPPGGGGPVRRDAASLAAADLLAFDAVSDGDRPITDLFIIEPTRRICPACALAATDRLARRGDQAAGGSPAIGRSPAIGPCGHPRRDDLWPVSGPPEFPRTSTGDPSWFADGQRLLVAVENPHSANTPYNRFTWGLDHDIWLVQGLGSSAQRLVSSHPDVAIRGPHASPDGAVLVYAEHQPTLARPSWHGSFVQIPPEPPEPARRRRDRWPTGFADRPPESSPRGSALPRWPAARENPWDGWCLHLADLHHGPGGLVTAVNHRRITPNGPGYYSVHGFHDRRRFSYSFTAGGQPFVDEIYEFDLDTGVSTWLAGDAGVHDDLGRVSPGGRAVAYASSRVIRGWRMPGGRLDQLRTEVFLRLTATGELVQLTAFNAAAHRNRRYLITDLDWSPDGRRLAVALTPVDRVFGRPDPTEIWLLSLPEPL